MQSVYGGHVEDAVTPFEKVREFHGTFGHPIGQSPSLPSESRLALRIKLIEEEYDEVLEAIANKDLPNLAKELADLIYVVNGFAIEAGIDLDEVFSEVHRSNMSKLDYDGKPVYREDGKVLKGPRYFEPDVDKILFG